VTVDKVPAILVGDEIDADDSIVVSIIVLDVVLEGRGGYRQPSDHHRHCPGMAAAGRRRPSSRASAVRDRAAVVGRLWFLLG
jgi:hypothetical protein